MRELVVFTKALMRESLQIPRVHKLEKNGDGEGKKSGGKLPAHDRSRE